MRIKVDRINLTKNTTLGTFSINDDFQCYTLEDTYHEIKIPGVTRIPIGEYELNLRRGGGLYRKYTKKFKYDHPMLWLRNVPGFEFIYIHILNYHYETEGCIGVGKDFSIDGAGDYVLKDSTKAYKEIYYPICNELESGKKVTIQVGDVILIEEKELKIPDSYERQPIKLSHRKATVSILEKMHHDLDSKAVLMGSMNFVTARLTGYKFFKDKIGVKNDQSPWGRLLELINVLITKLRGKAQ